MPDLGNFDQQITFLRTRDLEKSSTFYADVLGLELALDQGTCRIYRVQSGAFLGICRSDAHSPTDAVILTLVTPHVEQWHAKLLEHGAAVDGPPRLNETFAITQFFVRDPDGWLVEIQRFEDPRWYTGGIPTTDRS